MSSVVMPSVPEKLENQSKTGNSKNFKPDISPDLSGERQSTFYLSTKLSTLHSR